MKKPDYLVRAGITTAAVGALFVHKVVATLSCRQPPAGGAGRRRSIG
ncbi:MAG: hypothetical protein QOF89_2318 [Acidobacteriota bacterium]|jgi:hypothetical protein|nr:hypothetical protein [Acidobacteriota bacterium]